MKTKTKKIIISLGLTGGVICSSTIAGVSTILLINSSSKSNSKTIRISNNKLSGIYQNILNNYGKYSKNSPLVMEEFKDKVDDGTIKSFILNNYKDYFNVSDDSELDFELYLRDNSLIFSPSKDYSFEIDNADNSNSKIKLLDNKIIMNFSKDDFSSIKFFNYS